MVTHHFIRTIRLTRPQVFDVVLDVEQYPRFVPFWEAARVSDRRENSYRTDQIVKFKVVRQRFSGITTFQRPDWITVDSKGAGMRRFHLDWRFADDGADTCSVTLDVTLEFFSKSMESLVGAVTKETMKQLIDAFESEALRRAGCAAPANAAPGDTNGSSFLADR